jgi:hypothetical protein
MNYKIYNHLHLSYIFLLSITFSVVAAGVCCALSAEEVTPPMTDEEFFERVNLHHPGLDRVRAAYEAGSLHQAKAALAEYYRNRIGTYYFIDARNPAAGVRDPSRRLRGAEGLVMRRGVWDESLWEGNRFDWETAEMRFKERMYFFSAFAEAAVVEEGDEIAQALVHLIRSFVDQHPMPAERVRVSMLSTLAVGIRMRHEWPVTFLCLLQTTAFTDEDVVLFLKSVWDQTNFLYHNLSEASNWLTFELAGLYSSGAVYPEFKDAWDWRRRASMNTVEAMDVGWLPDGMIVEFSPPYGTFFSNYYRIYDLSEHVGRLDEFNIGEFYAKTETPFESFLRIMAPDRQTPAINNNGRADVVTVLKDALERFPERDDFRWIVTDGEEGEKPGFTSTDMPYSGFGVMRSGWERDANMLFCDFGPVGYRHAHQDGLAVNMWAYGRAVVFDDGLLGYDHHQALPNYAMDTFSHNTVLVDNRPQRRIWYDNPHPKRMPYQKQEDFRWRSTEAYDVAAGIYDEPYGMQGTSSSYPFYNESNFFEDWVYPATHYRRVLFLKPDIFIVADTLVAKDGESHEYDVRWHLDTVKRSIAENGSTVITEDAGQPNLELVALCTDGLEVRMTTAQMEPEILGWNAGRTDNPRPATTVQHIKTGPETVGFLTLLLPLRPDESSLMKSSRRVDDSTFEIELNDGRALIVEVPVDPSEDLSGHFH